MLPNKKINISACWVTLSKYVKIQDNLIDYVLKNINYSI